jgi:regulatory protein
MPAGAQSDPYVDALTLLARRELSEAQLRQRLSRRHHEPSAVESAIARLKADGSLNDERAAGAIARTEVGLRKRARRRVLRTIQAAGIASDTARRAVDAAFEDVDSDQHLAASLDRRLRGRPIAGDSDFRRLFRYLVAQGFDADRVMGLLERRRRSSDRQPDLQ